ncbi:MAG: TlpA family protein disulfide reductase [Pyrinomonadaceae bacterium]|nr:TlpA family protein disulfide reductase [Pyrinomonadaceae bacterium]
MKINKSHFRNFLKLFLLAIFAVNAAAQKSTDSDEKPLPNLKLKTVDGAVWNLHDDRGKIVLLNFWATWCEPCRTEIPVLQALVKKYETKGFKVVGVSLDSENLETIKEFIAEFKIKYPVVLTVPGSMLSQQESVPMSLLIGEKSVLYKKYVGAIEAEVFEKDIDELLNKPKP